MNRTLVVALAALIPLAAQAQPRSTGPSTEPEMNIRMKGFRQRVKLDTLAVWQPIPGPAVQTFRNTLRVLDSLDVPVAYADSIRGVIHHHGFVTRARLAGKNISSSFRCGLGLAGDYADSWRVSIAYAIFVKAEGEDSRLGVALLAGANDIEGVSKPAVQCGTTGGLEATIHKAVGIKAIQ